MARLRAADRRRILFCGELWSTTVTVVSPEPVVRPETFTWLPVTTAVPDGFTIAQ